MVPDTKPDAASSADPTADGLTVDGSTSGAIEVVSCMSAWIWVLASLSLRHTLFEWATELPSRWKGELGRRCDCVCNPQLKADTIWYYRTTTRAPGAVPRGQPLTHRWPAWPRWPRAPAHLRTAGDVLTQQRTREGKRLRFNSLLVLRCLFHASHSRSEERGHLHNLACAAGIPS